MIPINLLDTAASNGGNAQPNNIMNLLLTIGPILILFVAMYFIMIRPQKKREKEVTAMRSNLQVGDEVTTVGGLIGIVISMKDDTVVIETGGDKSKIRIARWAIQTNNTIHDN